jgi:hypothetical protein
MKKVVFHILIVFVLMSAFTACEDPFTHTPDKVEYTITGTAVTVDVTLNNSDGGTSQYTGVSVPHTYTYPDIKDWFLYISAQNNGSSGSVTVSIYLNDNLFKTSTSSGLM